MHSSTYEYLKPTEDQLQTMSRVREAAKIFNDVLDKELPEGPDKTHTVQNHRTASMWANIAITRQADGAPRV